MADCINNKKGVQAIVIVLNYNNGVLSNDLKTMIEIICNIFPFYKFWEHVCVVWTNCYNYTPQKQLDIHKKSKKDYYYPQLKRVIEEFSGNKEEYDIEPPMYYVDSHPDEGCDNSRSEMEIEKLLTWARSFKKPINIKREQKREDSEYKKVVTQEKQRRVEADENNINRMSQVKPMRRDIKIQYNGKVSCSEWEVMESKSEPDIKIKQEKLIQFNCTIL
ncbi:AIG1 family protein, putative [Entamoeba histolytica HM-1:IMSS-B]|nr:AIG1 family protein, putative [Entamoeba histolytica HM-1:IMSS-B]ENY62302.1 AIG1 family protein, putative [Entamoeba histolytica HM-1:IMSS-A]